MGGQKHIPVPGQLTVSTHAALGLNVGADLGEGVLPLALVRIGVVHRLQQHQLHRLLLVVREDGICVLGDDLGQKGISLLHHRIVPALLLAGGKERHQHVQDVRKAHRVRHDHEGETNSVRLVDQVAGHLLQKGAGQDDQPADLAARQLVDQPAGPLLVG